MPESQNIEYKTIWKDEYLKWICGSANAQGGTIFIGRYCFFECVSPQIHLVKHNRVAKILP